MPGRFDFISTPLAGLTVIQRKPMEDERGFLERFFCAEELREAGINKPIVQINRSLTRRVGTVRGMHFQYPPHAETKIVSCLKGEILTLPWISVRVQPHSCAGTEKCCPPTNRKSLLIPEGFAHGFQTLSR